ncbi:MAG: RHS repeat-associated core domain-containing protein [Polyangiaceae bacterium]|nr:RHS repeat-associated core domain-containing protein [Polyangiaceae bacterium]
MGCAQEDLPSPAPWPGFGDPWRSWRDALGEGSHRGASARDLHASVLTDERGAPRAPPSRGPARAPRGVRRCAASRVDANPRSAANARRRRTCPASTPSQSWLPRPSKARPTPPARAQAGNAGRARAREGRRREAPGGLGITGTDNGELLGKVDTATGDTTTLAYDAVGNLRGVGLPDGDLVEYLVDGRGRRVGKRVNGVLERGWLWRGQLQPVAELDGTGNVVARFVLAGGVNVPALMVTPTATYRLVTDHLGSVRRVADIATGAVAQELDYDAWGRVLLDTSPGLQPFGFAGGLYDPDTGLVRFGARDYDAETGRWTAKDPIGMGRASLNLFQYAWAAPQHFSDPEGRLPVLWPWVPPDASQLWDELFGEPVVERILDDVELPSPGSEGSPTVVDPLDCVFGAECVGVSGIGTFFPQCHVVRTSEIASCCRKATGYTGEDLGQDASGDDICPALPQEELLAYVRFKICLTDSLIAHGF